MLLADTENMTVSYFISRHGQEYGPYSWEDLRRYVSSGEIFNNDLVRSEGLTGTIPVSQVLDATPPPPPIASLPRVAVYPEPPHMHWALLCLCCYATAGIFIPIWNLVQRAWMKKVDPESSALSYYVIASLLCGLALFVGVTSRGDRDSTPVMVMLIFITSCIFFLVGRFSMRSSLERHLNELTPIRMRLGRIMTLLFGCVYFQYHLNRFEILRLRLSSHRLGQQAMDQSPSQRRNAWL